MGNKETERVHLTGSLTFNDYKKHLTYHLRKPVLFYFCFVFFFTVYFCYNIISDGAYIIIVPIVTIVATLVALIFSFLLNLLLRLLGRREFNSDLISKNEIKYIIDDEGIRQQVTERMHNFIEWRYIIKYYESEDLFRLYVSRRKAIIIPKRFFVSNDDLKVFKKIVNQNISRVKLMRK
ncbi:YcxB family protein [Gracilibacillus sp. S3-1-1]|uniref:YcxB family protein n=1 Tax=Gracilibacillus pellucidus TaxID=3095368 RepID=A0ACC6M2U0_9BACI|nr:YcxB family protein [Gracilibacillus sp. S3-1-1]MDX8045266.1 YcxB family protein [Gracilibacillus sp. S3-1-1]